MSAEEIPATQITFRANNSRLKKERERRGWTQSQIAESIGTTQANISRWENGAIPSLYYRQKLGELFGKSIEELGLFLEAEKENNEDVRDLPIPLASLAHSAHLPFWNIPYRRNPFFTGRVEVLSSLYAVLSSNNAAALTQAQAISGLGGIGKTQIAVEYAYRYRDRYQAILWVTAFSLDSLIADFVMLASLLDLPEQHEQNQDIAVRAVKRWLITHKDWLLILDNVDDLKMVTDFLPMQGTGNVLLTTRLQALGSIAQSIEVNKMELDEGVLFLLRRTKVLAPDAPLDLSKKESREQVAEIVTVLDGLPLALDQAGAYIEETRCGFPEYLNLYRTRRKELLLRRGMLPADHPKPVAATWSLSFQQVERDSLTAADLLRLLAFLNPDAIPEEIITEGAAELGPTLGLAASDPLQINEAILLLLRYSLLRRNPETKLLSIHRLVQAVLKDGMDKSSQRLWAERAVRAINRAFPDVELKTWAKCQRCITHAQISASYIEEYKLDFPESARVLNQAANYLSTHAHYSQAEPLLKQALTIRQQVLEPNHQDTASTLNDLGILYLTLGKYPQSVPLLRQALEIREQVLGVKKPATATSLNNLALLYFAQGKYDLAEQLYQQALSIRQNILKSEHPDIAQNLNNLAELYAVQGKYEQAEKLYLRARESQEKALGLHHPDVAKTLNNLALLYRSKGDYVKAEHFYKQALNIQEQVLGPKHPDVAETLNNLARLYRAQGTYAKAEPFYQRALNIREHVFGVDHPHVAQSLYSLAQLYYSQGKYPQAKEFCQEALRIQEQRLGNNHPTLSHTLAMLAMLYQLQQRYIEAEAFYGQALAILESALGSDHPQVAHIMSNVAEVYQAQGKYQQAEPLIVRSLAIREQSFGREHPDVAYSLNNLAENYVWQGDHTKAEKLYQEALTVRKKFLGPTHPRTASTLHNLANLYVTQGRYKEAESFYSQAQAVRAQMLGLEHPDVATGLEDYAKLMRIMNREEQARKYEAQAQAIRAKHAKNSELMRLW